jgi:hypothetical protein
LRARDDDFFDGKFFLANHLEHLCSPKRVDVDVFCDFRHVAAVCSLVKNDVDLVERARHRVEVTQVAYDELGFLIDPRRFAAPMGVRLQIVEHANFPAFAQKQIGDMRADQARATGNKRPFCPHVNGRLAMQPL